MKDIWEIFSLVSNFDMPITIGYLKDKLGQLPEWSQLSNDKSMFYKLLSIQELSNKGMINTVDFLCLCLLWCKEDNNEKEIVFKRLSKDFQCRYLLDRLVRTSTIFVYTNLQNFEVRQNLPFFTDQELGQFAQKIKVLVL